MLNTLLLPIFCSMEAWVDLYLSIADGLYIGGGAVWIYSA